MVSQIFDQHPGYMNFEWRSKERPSYNLRQNRYRWQNLALQVGPENPLTLYSMEPRRSHFARKARQQKSTKNVMISVYFTSNKIVTVISLKQDKVVRRNMLTINFRKFIYCTFKHRKNSSSFIHPWPSTIRFLATPKYKKKRRRVFTSNEYIINAVKFEIQKLEKKMSRIVLNLMINENC